MAWGRLVETMNRPGHGVRAPLLARYRLVDFHPYESFVDGQSDQQCQESSHLRPVGGESVGLAEEAAMTAHDPVRCVAHGDAPVTSRWQAAIKIIRLR